MKRTAVWVLSLLVFAIFLLAPAARASDHADPLNLTDPNANITGLFIFSKDDQYILVFNVRKSLREGRPYDLAPYEFEIDIDLTTPVLFDNDEDLQRYGGTIPVPDKLHADAAIKVRLNDDTSLKSIVYTGLKDTDKIRTYTGVRDDPFIFPRFFEKNVISMVLGIPKSAFPDGQTNFILWGVTYVDGKVSDRVGRSVRSQLPRFGFLNKPAPKDQVRVLLTVKKYLDGFYNFLNTRKEWWPQAIAGLLEFTFLIRDYDVAPDVMIYNATRPDGFPNGRRLTDDVNAIVCTTGDCLLQELSFIEAKDPKWPRATENDKKFLTEWPYLAEPWSDEPEKVNTASIWPYLLPVLAVTVFLIWGLVELFLWLACWLWRLVRRKFAEWRPA